MGTGAARLRSLGAPAARVCACGATSPFGEVTAGLGGARTGCGAVVRISFSTIWVAVDLARSAATSPGSGSTGTGLMGTEAAGVRSLGTPVAGVHARGATLAFCGVTAGLGVARSSCEGGCADCMSWVAVGLLGAALADPVRTGSTGTSLGTGFSGRRGASLELIGGNGGLLDPLERSFALGLRNEAGASHR